MLILLCKYDEEYEDKPENITNDDIDYTNNTFVLHMYLYIFV